MNISPINVRTWSKIGQASTFGLAVTELAQNRDDILLATADMSRNFAVERARELGKLINVGIAEENLLGVSAGLTKEGFCVFAFAQAAFSVTRCLDFIKVNMGYMNLPVILTGLMSGFSLGEYGATHIANDDIAQMRSIAGVSIVAPADCVETVKVIEAAAKSKTPLYIRLGGEGNMPIVYREDYPFEIGKAIKLREGRDVTFVATGTMVHYALKAAELLESDGIAAAVVNMHTIKPLDRAALEECLASKLVVTVEEHSVVGGLGSAVAEYLVTVQAHPPLLSIGAEDRYYHAGGYGYLMEQAGLTAGHLCRRVREAL